MFQFKMNANRSERDEIIDVAKGFLIILVVLGHVLLLEDDFRHNTIYKFCYSFHMFLFMYLGGRLIASKENNTLWLKHRFMRLMIPFFVWSILFDFLIKGYKLTDFMYVIFHILLSPMYWYLLVLYISDSFLVCSSLTLKKLFGSINNKYLSLLAGIIVCGILNGAYLYSSGVYIIKMTAIYYPFYFAGWFLTRYKIKAKECLCKTFALLYPFSMFFYGFKDRTKEAELLINCMEIISVPHSYINIIHKGFSGLGGVLYNHYIVAPLGCFFAWHLIIKLASLTKIKLFLSFVGYYSLSIYILHDVFRKQYTNIVFLDECLSFFLGILIPIILNRWIERSPKLNRIMFGI